MTKLGTSTYGSGTKPIYWNAGVPAAISATVGSSTTPMYSNSGTLTVCGTPYTNIKRDVWLLSGEQDGTAVSSGDDLDNYNECGNYQIRPDSIASSLSNCPTTRSSLLKIYSGAGRAPSNASGGAYITQWLEDYNAYIYLRYRTSTSGSWSSWNHLVKSSTSAVGGSTTPCYINSNGVATACSAMMPLTGSTFTGVAYAQTNTSYTTYQLRNIAFATSTPSSLTNGYVCMVYS